MDNITSNSEQVNNKANFRFAAISMAIAVVLGALAAHALKQFMPPEKIESFQTAVRYQIFHSLAIFAVALIPRDKYTFSKWVIPSFKWGIYLFSGSIVLLSTTLIHGQEWMRFLGPVTPIGGVFFIAGWVLLAYTIKSTR